MSEKHFFDKPRNLRRTLKIFFIASALLILLDLLDLLHVFPFKETHDGLEGWFGFYAIYGFVGCTLLVLAAKVLRKIVMREEDYYDR